MVLPQTILLKEIRMKYHTLTVSDESVELDMSGLTIDELTQ